MRIAIFSDIHGNLPALDAVLTDIERAGGVDETWVLGDMLGLGPHPVQVWHRLMALPNARFVRGNCDRYLVTGDRPYPSIADVEVDPSMIQRIVEVTGSLAWSQGACSVEGCREWLAELPVEHRTELPEGARVLCAHASPGHDDGPGLSNDRPFEMLASLLDGCRVDLVFAGHTHRTLDVHIRRTHVVNVGSVSNPLLPDLRASWALLIADEEGYAVEFHRAEYDTQSVIDDLERLQHPGRRWISAHLRGEFRP